MISLFVCNRDQIPRAHTLRLASAMLLQGLWTDENLGTEASLGFTALPPHSARLIVATKT